MPYSFLQQAAAFIQAGELDDALNALNQHLDQQADDQEALRLRLQVLRYFPGEDSQRMAHQDFAKLAESSAQDYLNLALIMAPAEALEYLRGAHDLWPENNVLTERYIRLLVAERELEAALTVVRQQDTRWHWLQWEGDLLVEQGDDMTATARYGLALARVEQMPPDPYLEPIKARLRLARATAYRRLGFYDQADGDYAAAEQMIPDDPAIPFNRGLIAWWRGNRQQAVELCSAALDRASAVLRSEMLSSIQADPRFGPLLVRLKR